jgi:metal-dependent amidase/aminoacylase/carboxypeptidase family protein
VRDLVERRISEIADGIARAYGGSAETNYTRMYPPTINHEREPAIAADVARDVVGADRVNDRTTPVMAGEDFASMLLERPGVSSAWATARRAIIPLTSSMTRSSATARRIGCEWWRRRCRPIDAN